VRMGTASELSWSTRADLDVIHLQPSSLERVIESLVALAALRLGAQAVLERLVPFLRLRTRSSSAR